MVTRWAVRGIKYLEESCRSNVRSTPRLTRSPHSLYPGLCELVSGDRPFGTDVVGSEAGSPLGGRWIMIILGEPGGLSP